MPIDAFGYDNAISQINSIKQDDLDRQIGVQDFNNQIQQTYNKDKQGEGIRDDETYVKDLMGNIMGASGLNSAYKNRSATILKNAKKRLLEITPADYSFSDDPENTATDNEPAETNNPPAQPDGDDNTQADGSTQPDGTRTTDVQDDGDTLNTMFDDDGTGGMGGNATAQDIVDTRRAFLQQGSNQARGSFTMGDRGNLTIEGGEPTARYRNGGTAEEFEGLKSTIEDAGEELSRLNKPKDPTLLGQAINKVSGGLVGEEGAETLGKWGGAITNGAVAGVDLYDGFDNLAHGKSFFGDGSSGIDDADKTLQMIAGASDIVGLIPGLEWVAGLGNVAGLTGSVIGAFGDHSKNVKQDQDVENELNQKRSMPTTTDTAGETAQLSQSTIRAQ